MAMEALDDALELVANVQLVRVKQQKNEVGSVSKPAANFGKVVATSESLLLAAEHSRSVHDGDVAQDLRAKLRAFKPTQARQAEAMYLPVEEIDAELLKAGGVSWDHALVGPVHHGHEPVRRGFRAHADTREVSPARLGRNLSKILHSNSCRSSRPPEELEGHLHFPAQTPTAPSGPPLPRRAGDLPDDVLDEAGLSRGVLADHENLWLRLELRIREHGRVEVLVAVFHGRKLTSTRIRKARARKYRAAHLNCCSTGRMNSLYSSLRRSITAIVASSLSAMAMVPSGRRSSSRGASKVTAEGRAEGRGREEL
eukprot:scaffold1748_cov258-Pinguiococcus_pyrenoidosus.AAC.12